MDFSTLYDFAISPLEDSSSSPEEKQAIGACLYRVGRKMERENTMYSQAPGIVLRSGSPKLVKACLVDVWRMNVRFVTPIPARQSVPQEGHGNQEEDGEASWRAFAAELKERDITNPADEAFRSAAIGDVFLHLVMQHRLHALMEALVLLREAMRIPTSGDAAAAFVARMNSLNYEEFTQFLMASEGMIPFSLALASQVLKKHIYLLYFIRNSGTSSFFRIGYNGHVRLTRFFGRRHRKNVICTPSCREIKPSLDLESKKKRSKSRAFAASMYLLDMWASK